MNRGKKRMLTKGRAATAQAKRSYNESYNRGYNQGYDLGHDQGYRNGWQAGATSCSQAFQGTSIIIVTTNDQREHLQNCIESIYQYTPEPFEIIIIDNASTDDTESYLKSLTGKIRFKVFKSNLGFAGGTNQGLRMARGTTLLFLNNDTIVTKNWLSNMLACLHSNEKFGLVGPTTNYISGEQLVPTTYTSTEEMHRFAEQINRSNPSQWQVTGRLTGFCVLMRREMFEALGYLDEGFEIGNCEDDDYGFRARLMGYELVIAKDTFIHHVGSVSIKALGERFEEVYGKNLDFYSKKWGESHSLLAEVQRKLNGALATMNHFYPTGVVVRGVLPQPYWMENGIKRPIEGLSEALASSRVSQVDLRSWSLGDPIQIQEVLYRLEQLNSTATSAAPLQEGELAETPDHTVYQMKEGKMRRLNHWALTHWLLLERGKRQISYSELGSYEQGLPIIAPAVIVANNV
ncbi:glycosyltransferase family 2 protein [Paenibacillus hexagrammi]|uniref:Glycosyltransferase family 2 protein n=1 Tax=Paenibacillus hexagrammi TaxID=2908839 RepID=A0ABY3SDL0_9BACL|nr:glycosyltransferase family 2 protein [Paenibacillus sp. YPD9-1]UJF32074.1 glycosyltransferase family 2 protein [Paenibacillus sp. YPD9-1]